MQCGWWKNRNSFELFGMSEHCVFVHLRVGSRRGKGMTENYCNYGVRTSSI